MGLSFDAIDFEAVLAVRELFVNRAGKGCV